MQNIVGGRAGVVNVSSCSCRLESGSVLSSLMDSFMIVKVRQVNALKIRIIQDRSP